MDLDELNTSVRILLTKKCLSCIDLWVDNNVNTVYSFDGVEHTCGYIGCFHQNICPMYDPEKTIDKLFNK